MGLSNTVRRRDIDAGYPGVLLTVGNAARLAGVAEGAIWEGIARGRLPARAGVRQGREVWLVPLDDLREEFEGAARTAPLVGGHDPEQAELRERIARLEGELSASERAERAAQRYADRVEVRASELEAAVEVERGKTLTLARALGHAEGERDRVQRLLAEPRRGLLGRLFGR